MSKTYNSNHEEGKENTSDGNNLNKLILRSNRVLIRISSVFPFDFFPDEVTIDENKVNIICRIFFFSEDIHSIMIPMIKDVEIETNLFFAAMKIVPDGYPGKPIVVRFLKKGDAICARRIIQGLMVANREKVNIGNLDSRNLKQKIEDLGRAREAEPF